MSGVSPVFTEYEQQVVRELALHRVQPNAIQRLLEGAGRPVAKLLKSGRESNSRALRGLSEKVHGWIEEGLIKTFRVANKLANTKEISKRYAVRGINVGNDYESLRNMPLSQLDAVAAEREGTAVDDVAARLQRDTAAGPEAQPIAVHPWR